MDIELTITARGQVTLRQAVLEHLGLKPGQKLGVVLLPEGKVEIQAVRDAPDVRRARGILKDKVRWPVTLEEMREAIERGPEE